MFCACNPLSATASSPLLCSALLPPIAMCVCVCVCACVERYATLCSLFSSPSQAPQEHASSSAAVAERKGTETSHTHRDTVAVTDTETVQKENPKHRSNLSPHHLLLISLCSSSLSLFPSFASCMHRLLQLLPLLLLLLPRLMHLIFFWSLFLMFRE